MDRTGTATAEELADNARQMAALRTVLQPITWEDTPAEAGRADRDYWTDHYDD